MAPYALRHRSPILGHLFLFASHIKLVHKFCWLYFLIIFLIYRPLITSTFLSLPSLLPIWILSQALWFSQLPSVLLEWAIENVAVIMSLCPPLWSSSALPIAYWIKAKFLSTLHYLAPTCLSSSALSCPAISPEPELSETLGTSSASTRSPAVPSEWIILLVPRLAGFSLPHASILGHLLEAASDRAFWIRLLSSVHPKGPLGGGDVLLDGL